MSAKIKINFICFPALGLVLACVAACTRKTTREVIGRSPVAIETTTPAPTQPQLPGGGNTVEIDVPFDGGRPEKLSVPESSAQPEGRFANIYAELQGGGIDDCREGQP